MSDLNLMCAFINDLTEQDLKILSYIREKGWVR